jgi:hypothetical protein
MFVSLLLNARCALLSLSVVPVVEQKYPSCTLFGKRLGARVAQNFCHGQVKQTVGRCEQSNVSVSLYQVTITTRSLIKDAAGTPAVCEMVFRLTA